MSRLKVNIIETTDARSLKIAPSVTIQNSSGVDRVIINGNGNGNLTVTCPIEVGTTTASKTAGQIGQVLTSQGGNYAPLWKNVAELPLYNEFPIGGIVMWSGSLNTIPSGYKLCDGTQWGTVKTPNLTDRFIIGASATNNVNATGGSKDAVVVSHTHTLTDPGHGHFFVMDDNLGGITNSNLGGKIGLQRLDKISGGGAKHEGDLHLYSTSNTDKTNITIASASSDTGTNKNLPPYYALYYIMRVS